MEMVTGNCRLHNMEKKSLFETSPGAGTTDHPDTFFSIRFTSSRFATFSGSSDNWANPYLNSEEAILKIDLLCLLNKTAQVS
jgi:hypothetical protein